jgi:hypothetical protein
MFKLANLLRPRLSSRLHELVRRVAGRPEKGHKRDRTDEAATRATLRKNASTLAADKDTHNEANLARVAGGVAYERSSWSAPT